MAPMASPPHHPAPRGGAMPNRRRAAANGADAPAAVLDIGETVVHGTARPAATPALAGMNGLAGQVAAADDAWVLCVVLLEKLQSPTLAPGEAAELLGELAACHGRFRQALRPIERLLAGDLPPVVGAAGP